MSMNSSGEIQLAQVEAVAFIRRFVTACHPTAEAALLAGSHVRGEATAGSDYDVVLLFASLPDGAWREMALFEGRHIEVFAHDLGTLSYFCREFDRPSGVPALPAMVAEGVTALAHPSPVLDAAREIARTILLLRPPQLDAHAIQARRYVITDLAAALQKDRAKGLLIAAGAALHAALADFALRAAGHWSASGKAIPRALTAVKPALAMRFETAFAALFSMGDMDPIQDLVDEVLIPYGGRLREGFRRGAPATWRDTPQTSSPGRQPPPGTGSPALCVLPGLVLGC